MTTDTLIGGGILIIYFAVLLAIYTKGYNEK